MSLLLRVDVDKPFGISSFFNRLRSKTSEDIGYPDLKFLNFGYLEHLHQLIQHCNKNQVKGVFYFRNCTKPSIETLELLNKGGHQIGFHAEDTRSIDTFKMELSEFMNGFGFELHSITKHGSGTLKLGKNHYPLYEPKKYLEWSKILDIKYLYGNEIAQNAEDFIPIDGFFEKMYWMERDYRSKSLFQIEEVVKIAENLTLPILIHPCSYAANSEVRNDFHQLINLAKLNSIEWQID